MIASLLAGLALATPTVDCARHVETDSVSARQRQAALRQSVRGHGVTFWGLRNAATRFRRERWKAGITVRHGAPMVVAVAPRDRDWLQLSYARKTGPVLRFEPCAPDTRRFTDGQPLGPETGWAGGFEVERPGCATLRLRRDGETRWTTVRAGFGVRCPGGASDEHR
jgi:hypothetical protein